MAWTKVSAASGQGAPGERAASAASPGHHQAGEEDGSEQEKYGKETLHEDSSWVSGARSAPSLPHAQGVKFSAMC